MRLTLAAFATFLLFGIGCGSQPEGPTTYRVEGVVQFQDGSPVRTGKIELLSEDEKWTATGTLNEKGEFTLGTNDSDDGAVEGTHKVIVTQFFIPGHPTMSLENAGPPVADIYGSFNTTTLTVKVEQAPLNRLKITVSSQSAP